MGMPRNIEIGNKYSGVKIEYVKSRKVINVWGWYDTCVGIEGREMPLWEFCAELGIKREDIPEEARDR